VRGISPAALNKDVAVDRTSGLRLLEYSERLLPWQPLASITASTGDCYQSHYLNRLDKTNEAMQSLVDHFIDNMSYLDSDNDHTQTYTDLTAHHSLAAMLEKKQHPTTQDLGDAANTGILSCPAEILETIFRFVSSDHDLAQVCKVNSRFFATALPWLYKHLHIHLKPKLDPAVLQMLTRPNTGLRFVQYVCVFGRKDLQDPTLMHQCLRIIINRVPRDRLKYFYWVGGGPLPPNLLSALWQRQKNLGCLDINPRVDPGNRNEILELRNQLQTLRFPKLKVLCVELFNQESARIASAALQCGEVTDLEVDAMSWVEGAARRYKPKKNNSSVGQYTGSDAGDEKHGHDPNFSVIDSLTGSLFRHLTRVQPEHKPSFKDITTLTLKDVDLALSKHTWFTYLLLGNLKELSLQYCKDADIFLLHLNARRGSHGALQSLELVHYVVDQADRTLTALEELLTCQSPEIHTLKICLRNTMRLPNTDAIRKHGDHLKKLLIDVAKKTPEEDPLTTAQRSPPSPPKPQRYSYPFYPISILQSLCESCPDLKELGIALPNCNLNFSRFLLNPNEANDTFYRHIDMIIRRLDLCTLHILNWPTNYEYGRQSTYYLAKNASLGRLANEIFKRYRNYDVDKKHFDNVDRHASLEIVAFGVNERFPTAPESVYFVPCSVDTLGRKSLYVQQVERDELHAQALDTDILDYNVRDFERVSHMGHEMIEEEESDEEGM
jgi:hypothetical protein